MRIGGWLVACGVAIGVAIGAAGCAQILGYGDLHERGADASTTDAPIDLGNPEIATDTIDASVDSGPPPVHLPDRPTGAAAPSGKGKTLWFIVKHYFLATQLRDGTQSSDAWKVLGWDIDHVCTGAKESEANTGTCKRVDGADPDVLVDGDGCRDNNFGEWVIPKIGTINPSFEDDSNKSLTRGGSTWIFEIEDLDDGPDDPYAPGFLVRAVPTPGTLSPKYDGTDVREASSDTVIAGDLKRPAVRFADGYVRGNHWVSGNPTSFEVRVPLGNLSADLPLAGATFDYVLSTDHKTATNGTIAGAIPWAQFETLLKPIAERAGFCPGSDLYTSFVKTVSKFPDVVVESATLQDVNVTCDGISIGLGFDLAPLQPVTTVTDPPPPSPSKCDAGVDG